MEFTNGKIVPVDIGKEMSNSYLSYAMSVIVGRALPDVRDGLKPVHRRILYGMYDLNLDPDKPHKKSARLVGEVMGKYHPHGDSAIYDAVVRMAQDFSMRGVLVDGHGNFGSVDGDSAAAMRYTEVRMSALATEMLRDIDKETIDYTLNFDESLNEPVVLPARFPNLLVNGSSGIAVGMATNMPPHNLGEVVDAVIKTIEDPDIPLEKLWMTIKGPDFPTAGIILGREGIKKAYQTGRGSVRIRARATIEQMQSGRSRIIVSELPYQVNKARLLETIADLVRDKKLEGISDLRDESDRVGMRMVIELKRDANPNVVLNQLYKHTQMQNNFGIINLAIVDGQPKYLGLKDIIFHYLDHQKEVVTRRTQYELKKAEERAHILEGYRIALDNIDEVIKLIRASKDIETARQGLMARFGLSLLQTNAILEMRLQRLTGLERDKIEKEYAELQITIARLRAILADEALLLALIKDELVEVRKKYADPRRTQIIDDEGEFAEEDLIAEEDIIITLTHRNYIKRIASDAYRSQRRGGRGVMGMTTGDEDFVEQLFFTTTHHQMLFFTTKGKVHALKAHEIPDQGRTARGKAIVNLLNLDPGENISAVIPIREYAEDSYLVMATRRGIIKKTELMKFNNVRNGGIVAVNLDEGDELISVRLTDGCQKILLGTRRGLSICFEENEVNVVGRTARGVRGIRLVGDDAVVGMDIAIDGSEVLTVTSKGMGKRTPISEYRTQARGGKGVRNIKLTDKNGEVIAVRLVKPGCDLMLTSREGQLICMSVDSLPLIGRSTQGNILMRMDPGDEVVDIAPLVKGGDDLEEANGNGSIVEDVDE
jgi:DNA gyrase subunit A